MSEMKTFSKEYKEKQRKCCSVSKSIICRAIQASTKIAYKDINAIFELLLEQIKTGLFNKNKISLRNFGTFHIRDSTYRGKKYNRIYFKPAIAFKQLIRKRERN